MNREQWLNEAVEKLRPIFTEAKVPLPDAGKLRVSCGWPSRGGVAAMPSKSEVAGECWASKATEDGTIQMFISPRLDSPLSVLGVLSHELVHAAVGHECKHRGRFKRVALAIGLEGPMTATTPGAALTAKLEAIVAELGAYPNVAINPSYKFKKQEARQLKVVCVTCGYLARVSSRWLKIGAPICPTDKTELSMDEETKAKLVEAQEADNEVEHGEGSEES